MQTPKRPSMPTTCSGCTTYWLMIFSSYTNISAWNTCARTQKEMPASIWGAVTDPRTCSPALANALAETRLMPSITRAMPRTWNPSCRRPRRKALMRHTKMTMVPRHICATETAMSAMPMQSSAVAVRSQQQGTRKIHLGTFRDCSACSCVRVQKYMGRHSSSPTIMKAACSHGWSKCSGVPPELMGAICMCWNFNSSMFTVPARSMTTMNT
mmetsp:Transcript_62498/g.160997  ORF Transcript_62498/g.160997 Transcript_62498/m.160997 type:complete len:212 (+) Transcript_62498:493-1128(+)